MIYDTIIIGLGPAGMSAAIYAKRNNLNAVVINKGMPGGLINQTSLVDNYLGFCGVTGPDLVVKMYKHFKSYEVPEIHEYVIKIDDYQNYKLITTDKGEYKTKAVIIATGRKNRHLKVTNAEKFEGKGISYCALCDGNLYKNKDIVIVGAGNSAFEEGIYLSNICHKVYVLVRSDKIRAVPSLITEMEEKDNIEILYNSEIDIIDGNDSVESITLTNGNIINVQGIFVYIGLEPATDFIADLNITNSQGYIDVNSDMETSIKGIFACGDVVNKKVYQIVTAVSEGSIAALSANKYRN